MTLFLRYTGYDELCKVFSFECLHGPDLLHSLDSAGGFGPPGRGIEALRVRKNSFVKKIIPVVVDLHWKDFEILIDLIFRQGGWFRQKAIGGTEETIDLSLYSPITNERIAVQIKTQSDLNEFKKYEKKFRKMKSYDRKFYVVHTMDKRLMKYSPSKGIFLWTDEKVAEQIINLGLVEWLIEKAA